MILFIDACMRPDSRTRRLAKHLLAQLDDTVETLVLEREEDLRPLNGSALARRDAAVAAEDFSDPMFRYARQFAAADTVVLAAPYWDLSFPAVVRTYLEAITVPHLTFRYAEDGRPQGLCRAKRLIYVMTSGGPVFCDFGYRYVEALAGALYGIEEVRLLSAENLDIVGNDPEAILARAMENADTLAQMLQ